MAVVEIICLANSRKRGGRCVAGLRTDGGGWIRPVVLTDDGALRMFHYRLNDGSEPAVLDVLRFHVESPHPGPHHPEDWTLRFMPWELVERPAARARLALLSRHLIAGPAVFGNTADRIAFEQIKRQPLTSSLALVQPAGLHWRIAQTSKGKRQTRAVFDLAGTPYSLVLSDPLWESRLANLAVGDHPLSAAGLHAAQRVWLTLSITEPFNEECYKLVAAVIPLSPGFGGHAAANGVQSRRMTAETIRNFLQRRPFEPMRVKMSSGESFEIRHPEMALLTRAGLIIVLPDDQGAPSERIEFCSFLHIAGIETAAFA